MYALQRSLAPFGAVAPEQLPSGPQNLSFSSFLEGFPRGALIEISGNANTEIAARFLAEHQQMPAAWIEENLKPFPQGIREQNPNLKKILFIEGAKDSSWAAGAILKSGLFPILIYRAPYGDIKELRRFRFHAKKSNTTIILLRDEPCFAWPIHLQLRASEQGLELLRRRRNA